MKIYNVFYFFTCNQNVNISKYKHLDILKIPKIKDRVLRLHKNGSVNVVFQVCTKVTSLTLSYLDGYQLRLRLRLPVWRCLTLSRYQVWSWRYIRNHIFSRFCDFGKLIFDKLIYIDKNILIQLIKKSNTLPS